ncbi:MAG: hypothetical protein OXG68_03160 [Chloroflexi bacterium]|nr:hypothetical protein [Chloroflexota bacterium]
MQLLLTASECAAFSAASFPKTGNAAENDRTKTSAITDHFFTILTPFAIMTKNFIVQEAFRASQATLCIMPKSLRNILGRLNEGLGCSETKSGKLDFHRNGYTAIQQGSGEYCGYE